MSCFASIEFPQLLDPQLILGGPLISMPVFAFILVGPFFIALLFAFLRRRAGRYGQHALDLFFLLPLLLPFSQVFLFIQDHWRLNMKATASVWGEENVPFFMLRFQGYVNSVFLMGCYDLLIACALSYFCCRFGVENSRPELSDAARLQGMGAFSRFWHSRASTAKQALILALIIGLSRGGSFIHMISNTFAVIAA